MVRDDFLHALEKYNNSTLPYPPLAMTEEEIKLLDATQKSKLAKADINDKEASIEVKKEKVIEMQKKTAREDTMAKLTLIIAPIFCVVVLIGLINLGAGTDRALANISNAVKDIVSLMKIYGQSVTNLLGVGLVGYLVFGIFNYFKRK